MMRCHFAVLSLNKDIYFDLRYIQAFHIAHIAGPFSCRSPCMCSDDITLPYPWFYDPRDRTGRMRLSRYRDMSRASYLLYVRDYLPITVSMYTEGNAHLRPRYVFLIVELKVHNRLDIFAKLSQTSLVKSSIVGQFHSQRPFGNV